MQPVECKEATASYVEPFPICILWKKCANSTEVQDFPDRGRDINPKGAPIYYFDKFYQKTIWKWKKLNQEEVCIPGAHLQSPMKMHDNMDKEFLNI